MAINVIDTQIMINRTSDMSREVSYQQKRDDVAQEFLAVHEKAMTKQEGKKVGKAGEVEQGKLGLTGDGKGSNTGGRQNTKKELNKTEDALPSATLVPSEERLLDVKA